MAAEPSTELFRQRARAEAARYGSDPWVFVRELLQNARDAGAGRVAIEVSRNGSHEQVSLRDDGCGMSYEHARRYLFALYASSKENSREQAGKFGIGFWSVLRFEPSTIVIRSCSRGKRAGGSSRGEAWQVSLDGTLDRVEVSPADLETGTEIVLERPARDGCDLAAEVMAATRRYGRFLSRRGDPETPLPVTVDGRSANAELKLEAPSATFRGKGFRGVVGLGPVPEVELFAQGLFVRSASSLQDLRAAGELSGGAAATTEDVLAELPSLTPRVLIDSAELDLLLARSDARYDKHLRRILRTAEKQLGRLITRQLQALRPQPFYRLWLGALRDRLDPMFSRQLAVAGLVGLAIGLAMLWLLPFDSWVPFAVARGEDRHRPAVAASAGDLPESPDRVLREAVRSPEHARSRPEKGDLPAASGQSVPPAGGGVAGAGASWQMGPFAAGARRNSSTSGAAGQAFHAYTDLADRYRGPRPGGFAGEPSRLAMLYEPADATPFFAALVIEDLTANRWAPSTVTGDPRLYRGVDCPPKDGPITSAGAGCVEARLLVAGSENAVRIPVPTGHRLDVASLRFDGRSETIYETANGEALLRLPGGPSGVVEYRTGPARSLDRTPRGAPPAPPEAPAELMEMAAKIRRLPAEERVQRALDYVAQRVVYDRSPAARGRYALTGGGAGRGHGRGFVELALDAGSGDCDVQSGVLVTLLRLAGVNARLALGYAGSQGTVAPGLHAWVEVRQPDGGWTVADPSVAAGDASGPSVLAAGLADMRFPRTESRWPPLQAVPLAAAALLLGVAAWSLRRRSATGIELIRWPAPDGTSSGEDLAALLGGALRHPEAFAGLPAMFHGRFVPLLGRRGGHSGGGRTKCISLARARRMASKNRLFRSSAGSQLARRAAARGVPVIDASTGEGRVLSLALGAIDVDHWSNLLASSSRSELTRCIDRRLDQLDASFGLREAPEMNRPWMEVALEDLKLGRRQILVDPGRPEYAPVRSLARDRPEAAAFTMLDVLLHDVELPERERARILAAFAQPAVEEAAGNDRDPS